jgi:hypothetical protein
MGSPRSGRCGSRHNVVKLLGAWATVTGGSKRSRCKSWPRLAENMLQFWIPVQVVQSSPKSNAFSITSRIAINYLELWCHPHAKLFADYNKPNMIQVSPYMSQKEVRIRRTDPNQTQCHVTWRFGNNWFQNLITFPGMYLESCLPRCHSVYPAASKSREQAFYWLLRKHR